jgi:CHAT domain-containing protein
MLREFLFRYRPLVTVFCLSLFVFINISISTVASGGESSRDNLVLVQAAKLSSQAQDLYEVGRFADAAELWQQAADIYAEKGKDENSLQNSVNVAEALQAGGLYLRACDTLLQAFEMREFGCRNLIQEQDLASKQDLITHLVDRFTNSAAKANGLRSLGDVLLKLDALKLANILLVDSLAVSEKLSGSDGVSAALLSLGNLKKAQGDAVELATQINSNIDSNSYTEGIYYSCHVNRTVNDAAVKYYHQAADFYGRVAAKADSQIILLQALTNQLGIFITLGDWSKAQKLWLPIKPLLNSLPSTKTANYARINLAEKLVCLRQVGKVALPTDAKIKHILLKAIAVAKSTQDRLTESYGLGYLGRFYQQTQQPDKAIALTQQALILAQANQAPEITYQWQWQLGYLLKKKGDTPGAIAAYTEAVNNLQYLRNNLVALEQKVQFYFREQVKPVYQQLVDLLLQSEPNQANLVSARQTIESLQLLELENFFRQACLESKVEIDEIVDENDDNSAVAVVYPIILPDRLEIIVKLAGQNQLLHFKTAVKGDRLEATLDELRADLLDVSKTYQVQQRSQQLYNWLIKPLARQLQQNQIETLVFVLDGSLRNIPMSVLYDSQQQQYLIEKYAIAIAPGLQLVQSRSLTPDNSNVLLAGISQKRMIARRDFSALTNVKQELQQIQSQVKESQELINQDFTQANFQKQLESKEFSTIHLATHGTFSSNPEQTFILTWDRLLQADNLTSLIQQYNLNREDAIELLVLSACETATGDNLAALGLAGITVKAGVRSTLATLWFVDDLYAAEIMSSFYQELGAGKSKAKALQQAQITILKQEERPYFWSPFILLGNWL